MEQVGAAVACPERRVVALQADGSAMYTIQSLWTMGVDNAFFSEPFYHVLIDN